MGRLSLPGTAQTVSLQNKVLSWYNCCDLKGHVERSHSHDHKTSISIFVSKWEKQQQEVLKRFFFVVVLLFVCFIFLT